MYRKNPRSSQPLLLSNVNDLPPQLLARLEGSWAATFRSEVFGRINEDSFAVLYSEKVSRPNTPVNVLLGLEILKAGRGWSDEELYEHFTFDLQVRYAVGCDVFGDRDFCLRTLYYFRQRLVEHALRTGENLLATVFNQVTDAQLAQWGIRTDQQRLDSTQVLSNIADLSRLELLLEVLQRLWRLLRPEDQARHATTFAPYIKERAGQYTYRLKGREAVWAHIGQVGCVLHGLLGELRAGYGAEAFYAVAQRFFAENFVLEAAGPRAKGNSEIEAGSLQSLDDLEATYRQKGQRAYKGYVAHLAETCHPDNPVQLIDQVQVAPNRVSDVQLLQEGLPELHQRTGVTTVVTDGAYVSPEVDAVARRLGIEQLSTGLTGTLPDHSAGRLAFSDFALTLDAEGEVTQVTCPAGHPGRSRASGDQTYRWDFAPEVCGACPLAAQCPVKPNRTQTACAVSVPKDRARSAQRRRLFEQHKARARNLRTAVEATMFQLKHRWVRGKVRVRGQVRVTMTVLCTALAVNARRLARYRRKMQRGKITPPRRPTVARPAPAR
jgi:hypothetical protein